MRIGNAAVEQLQLDVYGEVIDSLALARRSGLPSKPHVWRVQCALMDFLETALAPAGRGDLGGARPAPALRALQGDGLGGRRPRGAQLEDDSGARRRRWSGGGRMRDEVHQEVCEQRLRRRAQHVHPVLRLGELDAAAAAHPARRLPAAGRPAGRRHHRGDQGRAGGTDGFVRRYQHGDGPEVDGLPGDEGAFLACSFWLADALR